MANRRNTGKDDRRSYRTGIGTAIQDAVGRGVGHAVNRGVAVRDRIQKASQAAVRELWAKMRGGGPTVGKPYSEIFRGATGRSSAAAGFLDRQARNVRQVMQPVLERVRDRAAVFLDAESALSGAIERANLPELTQFGNEFLDAQSQFQSAKDTARQALRQRAKDVNKASSKAVLRLVKQEMGPKTLAEKFGSKIVSTGETVGSGLRKAGSHLNPFKPGVARRFLAEATHFRALPGAKGGIVRAAGRFVPSLIRTPGRVGAWALNGISRAGAGMSAKFSTKLAGRAVVGAGRMVRGAFTPAGFAASAWIDAGVNAYDFFANGGLDTMKAFLGDKDAKIDWGDFASDYTLQVLDGFSRVLTFGLWGSNPNRRFAEDPNQLTDEERFNLEMAKPGEVDALVGTTQANEALEARIAETLDEKQLTQRREMLAKAKSISERAQIRANFDRLDVNAKAFRDYLWKLHEDRDAKLTEIARIRDDWDEERKTNRALQWDSSAESYYQNASRRVLRQFDKDMSIAMENKTAKTVLDENRRLAYAKYFGGDYDRDYELDAINPGSVARFTAFRDSWEPLDDRVKVMWAPDMDR